MTLRYEKFRREYTAGGLSLETLDDCPFQQFEIWLAQVIKAELIDPTAMVLATIAESGFVWQRIVLLKGFKEGSFVFYTNQESGKALAMASEPRVSLLFPWNALDRQVIVAGHVEKIGREEANTYFQSRPRESQIAAWASQQSEPISDRGALEEKAQLIRERFGEGDIPMPEFWGGYQVVPTELEFWQGGEHRLHDRFRYRLNEVGQWTITQLQP
ncbi:MAG: pyridoxamine 5'-phosphate oxidase [Halioglobus sp.]|jgi:pyridoxamine 5'-phosphate oxidase